MEFLLYLLALIIGFLVGALLLSTIMIILRVGISNCNKLIKENITNSDAVNTLKLQRNKYILSLILQIGIVTLITFLMYKFLSQVFICYVIAAFLVLLFNFQSTGNTKTNLEEFFQHLSITEKNKVQYSSNNEQIINELCSRSGLSYELCSDILDILLLFKNNDKEKGIENIHNILIPHLKSIGDITIIGIAFGMLIDNELGLSEEEANRYSQQIIFEMVGEE